MGYNKLGNYIKIKHGYAFKGNYISAEDNGVVLVTPGNFKIGGGFKEDKCKFFTDKYPDEYVLQPDDLIVTMTDLSKDGDTLGYSAKIPSSDRIYLHNQRIGLVSVIDRDMDKDYLYWFLRTPMYQKSIVATASGSTVKHTSPSRIYDIKVDLPSLKIQKRIAGILCTIEDKIEVNQKINRNLEQQAQALFKTWFIDFKPFEGSVPSDWTYSSLGEVSDMGAGGDKPEKASPVKTDLLPFPIYSNGLKDEGIYGYTDKAKIEEESVTVSARGTIGFVCLRHIPYVPIVRLVTLVPKSNIISAKYLYLYLKQLHITGTGTTQQQLTVPDFKKTEILVPSRYVVDNFTEIVSPLFEKIWSNQEENLRLFEIRDTLLPKLMSGEVDVSGLDL